MSPVHPTTGVLVMAHGTPATRDGIEPFYTTIRRGSPPTPELLAELVGRYEAIGGTSPLTERTRAQVDGLAAALEARAPDQFVVRFGAKYVSPTIEEGMTALAEAGVDRVVGIVLTPHQSSLGSGEYLRRAGAAADSATPPLPFIPVASWHRADGFARILADRTRACLASLGGTGGVPTALFFTAHSLPLRVVGEGDPYPGQVAETAADIATLLDLDAIPDLTWSVAWQSAGRTADPWIGPDLLLEIKAAADRGVRAVAVCPVGFVSDHLEILYDLDIEADGVARGAGMSFARTTSLNDDPAFSDLLADVVGRAAGSDPAAPDSAAGSDPAATSTSRA